MQHTLAMMTLPDDAGLCWAPASDFGGGRTAFAPFRRQGASKSCGEELRRSGASREEIDDTSVESAKVEFWLALGALSAMSAVCSALTAPSAAGRRSLSPARPPIAMFSRRLSGFVVTGVPPATFDA